MKTQNVIKRNFLLLVLLLFSFITFSQTIFADEKANYDGVKRIVVEGRFCDVDIKGENREDVKFEGIIKGTSGRGKAYEIKHQLDGNTLRVWIESPKSSWGNVDAYLRFMVPQNTVIDVKNSSGDVFCDNISSEFTKIRASSGDVNVKLLTSNLDVVTSSGDVTLYEIKGDVTAHSSSGNHKYQKVAGNVNCEATSGDLEMENVIGDISSRTSSGNVDFDKIEGRVKSVSSSGNIEVRNSKTILSLTSTSGNVRGQSLVLLGESFFKATSGDVSMMFLNDFDQLSFDLSASSGDLKVGSRKADNKLYVKNGEIWVHGKTSSGNQTFK